MCDVGRGYLLHAERERSDNKLDSLHWLLCHFELDNCEGESVRSRVHTKRGRDGRFYEVAPRDITE